MTRRFKPHPAELRKVLDLLRREIEEGVRHGFYSCAVSCEVVGGGRRQIRITAGKSYQFVIGEEEGPETERLP